MSELEDGERGEAEEIMGRIADEHRETGHTLGPIAGCGLCAIRLAAGQSPQRTAPRPVPGPTPGSDDLVDLAAARARAAAALPSVHRMMIAPRQREPGGMADVALDRAQTALDCAAAAGANTTQEGIVHALVAVAYAIAGLDETLRRQAPPEAPPGGGIA